MPALRGLTRDLGRTYGIKITFANSDGIPTVPPDVALCLFRVAQEALMNVAKHSRAKSTEVQLSSKNGAGPVQLTVTDDAEGFDPRLSPNRKPGAHQHARAAANGGRTVGNLIAAQKGHAGKSRGSSARCLCLTRISP